MNDIDLDVLRGWAEAIDESLRQPHELTPLARLVPIDAGPDARVETIHGPDVLMGRFHPQYGPVDIIPRGLQDHQNYRLGAPHLQLSAAGACEWTVRSLSPGATTLVGDESIDQPSELCPITDGDRLTLGCVSYRFELSGVDLDEWERERLRLLDAGSGPALYLGRRGGPCGPRFELDGRDAVVLGRSFPRDGVLSGDHQWDGLPQPDWDLAGLHGAERKHIAFRHARLRRDGERWSITPLSMRHKTFVNRAEILDSTPIEVGDEIALGPIILFLHEPDSDAAPRRMAIEPPAVVDWGEGSTPILEEPSDVDQPTEESP